MRRWLGLLEARMGGACSRPGNAAGLLTCPRAFRSHRAPSHAWFSSLVSEEGPHLASTSSQDTQRRRGPECGPGI